MEVKFGNIEQFFTALENPEYAYLYLEPVLIWGLGFGLLAFLFATIVREPKTQSFGLIILAVSCMLVGPYCNKRKIAEKRIVSVYQIDQPTRASGFSAETNDRRNMQWLYYLTAALAVATLLMGAAKSKLGFTLAGVTVIVGASAILYSSIAHYQEAQLNHPNLRQASPSPPPQSVAGRLTPMTLPPQ